MRVGSALQVTVAVKAIAMVIIGEIARIMVESDNGWITGLSNSAEQVLLVWSIEAISGLNFDQIEPKFR